MRTSIMAEEDRTHRPPVRKRRRTGALLAVAAVAVAAGVGAWWVFLRPSGDDSQQQAQAAARTITVTAGEAEAATWQPELRAVGTISALRSIDLTSEVAGQVESVRFDSGDVVEAGDVLLTLEDDQDRAQLADLEASRDLARAELSRQRQLARDGYTPEAELDRAQATFASAEAKVAAQQERIDEKTIEAPFSGKLGIREINEGAYIQPGQAIVSLSALTPIRVIFTLPQQQLAQVETGQRVAVTVSSYPDRSFPGIIRAIDPVLDRRTRTFQVEAELDNDDQALRPGMFADVAVLLPAQENVVTVPQSAISYNPYGDFVFLVREQEPSDASAQPRQDQARQDQTQQTPPDQSGGPVLIAERRFITAGERRGSQIAVVKGVEAGQRVVTSGLHKVQDGARLAIDNSITPPSVAEVQQVDSLVPPVEDDSPSGRSE